MSYNWEGIEITEHFQITSENVYEDPNVKISNDFPLINLY